MPAPAPSPAGRALLAEDDAASASLVMDLIRGMGWEVDHAADGLQVLAMTAATRYDLLLLDLHMPNLDGTDVLRVLSLRPESAPTRIVVVTADLLYGIRADLAELGADVMLGKPIDLGALETVLAETARGRAGGAARATSAA